MEIRLIAEDENREELDTIDHFDFLKEARAWVKDAWLSPDYWDRRSEIDGYHKRVYTIQLLKRKNMWDPWECVEDWFPKFHKSDKENEPDT